jgi:hypothetical protein
MPSRSRLAEAFVLAAILSAFWLVRWPFRDTVLIRDEGEYAYIGQRILLGDVPYRDVYNQKTPFAFYAMAAGQALVGPSVAELRAFGSAYGLLSTSAVWALARAAFGPLGAAAAAASFAALVFDQAGIVHQQSTEYFMLLWLALGVLAWDRAHRPERPRRAACAGALAALACLTKQSGAALLLFYAADALWRRRREGRAGLAGAGLAFAAALAGFAAVFALVAAYFAAEGALAQFVEAAWLHIGGYVGGHYEAIGLRTQLAGIADFIGRDAGFWAAGSLGLLHAARSRTGAASGGWLLLLVLLAAAIAPGGNSRHYLLPVVLPLALGMAALAQALPQQNGAIRAGFALALLLPWLGPLAYGYRLLHPGLADPPARLLRPFDRAEAIGRALAARTAPGEPVLIVGSEPQIYYFAERPAATRLVHLYTATGPYRSAPSLRAEFMRDLTEERPRYVLLVNVVSSLTEFPDRLGLFLLPVLEVLRRDYAVEERWEGPGQDVAVLGLGQAEFVLWRLREATR